MNKQYYVWILMLVASFMPTLQAQQNLLAPSYNPFSKPDLMKARPLPQQRPPGREPQQPVVPEFTLNATLISVNTPQALINGQLIQQGETVNGVKLLMVDEGRVEIRYKGKNYSISIEDAAMQQDKPVIVSEPGETM